MELKPITQEGIPAALQKAERYRLLNESSAAESICLDVLEIDPKNQEALVSLLLSITDQFGEELSEGVHRARDVLPKLTDEYERAYYAGIISERRANAQLHRGALGFWSSVASGAVSSGHATWYEKAEKMRPSGNDEAILRWNTCVRMLKRGTSACRRARRSMSRRRMTKRLSSRGAIATRDLLSPVRDMRFFAPLGMTPAVGITVTSTVRAARSGDFERVDLVGAQRDVERGDRVLQMTELRRADNWCGDIALRE